MGSDVCILPFPFSTPAHLDTTNTGGRMCIVVDSASQNQHKVAGSACSHQGEEGTIHCAHHANILPFGYYYQKDYSH